MDEVTVGLEGRRVGAGGGWTEGRRVGATLGRIVVSKK